MMHIPSVCVCDHVCVCVWYPPIVTLWVWAASRQLTTTSVSRNLVFVTVCRRMYTRTRPCKFYFFLRTYPGRRRALLISHLFFLWAGGVTTQVALSTFRTDSPASCPVRVSFIVDSRNPYQGNSETYEVTVNIADAFGSLPSSLNMQRGPLSVFVPTLPTPTARAYIA